MSKSCSIGTEGADRNYNRAMEDAAAHKESTVKDFLDVVFRRKWIILGIVTMATSVVIVFSMKEPASYESVAKILVKRGESQGVYSQSIRTLSWEEEISSQIEMIKSQVVASRAQELLTDFYPEGKEPAQKINAGRVNSGVISTSNVLWVAYTSMDPLFCEAAVNAIVNAYKEYYENVKTPPEMEDFFSRELSTLREEIEYWRKRKERIEKEWGIVDIKQQRSITLNCLERYRTEFDKLVQERLEIEEVISRLEKFQELDIDEQSAVSIGLINTSGDMEVRNLRRRLHELKGEESEMSMGYTDNNKRLIKVRKQIEDLQTMLGKEVRSLILITKSKLKIMIRKQETLMDLAEPLKVEKGQYPKKEVELERINVSLQRLEINYKDLVRQHMDAKLSVASNPEWNITILNAASRAYHKKTRDYVRMALGPFFSFVIALGLAFFVDNLDHSIKNVADAEQNFDLPVLASFPNSK